MKKPFIVPPLACFIMLLFSACEKEEDITTDPVQEALAESLLICPSPTEHHFSGYVFDEVKCMNHFINQGMEDNSPYIASLSSTTKYNPERTYFEFWIESSPLQIGGEHLKVITPNVSLKDLEEIDQLLSPGKKQFSDSVEARSLGNKGYVVEFLVVESMGESPYYFPSYATYSTKFGEQQGSSLEIVSKSKSIFPPNSSRHQFQLTFLINCKLYDENGIYKGSIKNGVLKPYMAVTEGEPEW